MSDLKLTSNYVPTNQIPQKTSRIISDTLAITAAVASMAANLIKYYLMSPMIVDVIIATESYKESYKNNVSKQMIIDQTGGRKWVSDNIAPEPATFTITGYIMPEPYEFTTFFMPSLKLKKKKLLTYRNMRDFVLFRDAGGKFHQVAIESIDFDEKAETQSCLPVTIQLIEIDPLYANTVTVDNVDSSAQPQQGDINGTDANNGITNGTQADDRTDLYKAGQTAGWIPQAPLKG